MIVIHTLVCWKLRISIFPSAALAKVLNHKSLCIDGRHRILMNTRTEMKISSTIKQAIRDRFSRVGRKT